MQVKDLYDTYVQKIPKLANQTPTYPSWFEPHIMRWFEEYKENSLTFVENAVKTDKLEGVRNSASCGQHQCGIIVLVCKIR